jgi:hypothetical protein
MVSYPVILSSSDQFPWPMLIGIVVLVLIVLGRSLGSASQNKASGTAPKPPSALIPPSLFAGVQAGRLVAPPPPPPRRLRKVAGPPPPRPRPRAAATASEESGFPEARASASGAQTAARADARSLPGSSIVAELRSPRSIRSAIILTEVLDRPAVLREEPSRSE